MRKCVPALSVLVFLVGTSWVAWQLYGNAYDDLPTFFWATHLAFADKVSVYQPGYFHELGHSLNRKIYPFLYPPPSLLLFSPFLLGNYEQVKVIYSALNLVLWWLLMWGAYQLYRFHTGYRDSRYAAVLIPLWLVACTPVIDTLRTGQVNLLVVTCLAPLFFQSTRLFYQYASGVLLALAIVLKVYLLLLLPVLLLLRRHNILLGAVCALVILGSASLWLLPQGLWTDWLMFSLHSGGYGKQVPDVLTIPWNQSINGFFIRQHLGKKIPGETTDWLLAIYLMGGAVLLSTLGMVWRYLRQTDDGLSLAIALTLLAMTLIAPLTWLHHFVFALPAAVCCLALSRRAGWRTGVGKWMSVCVCLFVVLLSYPWLFSIDKMNPAHQGTGLLVNLRLSIPLLAGTGLWFLFCVIIMRQQGDGTKNHDKSG